MKRGTPSATCVDAPHRWPMPIPNTVEARLAAGRVRFEPIPAARAAEADVLQSYGLHADWSTVKPVDFEKFAVVVRTLESHGFVVVTLLSGVAT